MSLPTIPLEPAAVIEYLARGPGSEEQRGHEIAVRIVSLAKVARAAVPGLAQLVVAAIASSKREFVNNLAKGLVKHLLDVCRRDDEADDSGDDNALGEIGALELDDVPVGANDPLADTDRENDEVDALEESWAAEEARALSELLLCIFGRLRAESTFDVVVKRVFECTPSQAKIASLCTLLDPTGSHDVMPKPHHFDRVQAIVDDADLDDELCRPLRDLLRRRELGWPVPETRAHSPVPPLSTAGDGFFLNRLWGAQPSPSNATVTFSGLIEPDVRYAFLTTYLLNLDWVVASFAPGTRMTVARNWNREKEKAGIFQCGPNVQILHPPMGERGIFHAQLCVFSYADHVRVVISSCNLVPEEWLFVNQQIWFQDFPRLAGTARPHSKRGRLFKLHLKDMIQQCGANAEFLNDFDFSNAAGYLVGSVAGQHPAARLGGGDVAYGVWGLRNALRDLPVDQLHPSDEIVYQASSIGGLWAGWIQRFMEACSPPDQPLQESQLRIVYPTEKAANAPGVRGQEMIDLLESNWKKPGFPQHAMRQIVINDGARRHTVLHSKIMMRCARATDNGPGTQRWVYIGSHNLSQGAWGNIKRSGRGEVLELRNYELGIVLYNQPDEPRAPWEAAVPFQMPPPLYGPSDMPFISPDWTVKA
eukprot:TRINITY_DN31374_c0_g1_i1.p1 TRINITY_DN31374_c0_g1~~TRINITY_DN31374_c0_g1_i1.p1  ORF type:complete len:648 (-),score=101.88 TRINITY_DN31374_c0_g1_i1:113-2056(-)